MLKIFAALVSVPPMHAAYSSGRATRPQLVARLCACASDANLLPVQLHESYESSIAALLDEISTTSAGDRVELSLYLIEGGDSSERVLAALQAAGRQRGVQVHFGLDVSYVSMISRLTERTDTLIPRVAEMARAEPQWVTVAFRKKPDHSKYALFIRRDNAAAPMPEPTPIGPAPRRQRQ